MYDFTRCKLCAQPAAATDYRLHKATLYRCRACDFHYIDHLDDLASLPETAALDERSCRLIAAKLPANARLHRARLAFVKKHAAIAGAHCLDIGAGVGFYLRLLADAGASIHGIEPNSINRAFARQKFDLVLDPHSLDQPNRPEQGDDPFDLATLWDVIEHVNFPRQTLAQAFAVLKPGGWLFLDTPSRDSLYYLISAFIYRRSQGRKAHLLNTLYSAAPFGHKQIFRPQQLAQLLTEVGFEIVTLKGFHELDIPVGRGLKTLINAGAGLIRPKDKIVIACRKPATVKQ